MALVAEYIEARKGESVARLRRLLALRAMTAEGLSQRRIAEALGVSQPAVSQQLKSGGDLAEIHPELLMEAGGPILKEMAKERGYSRLAVFGSVARGEARVDSDIDLLVQAPGGTSSFDFLKLKLLFEQVLGREIDLIEYGGLKPGLDDDIWDEAVLL